MTERIVEGVPFAVWGDAGGPAVLLLHGFTGTPAAWTEVAASLPDGVLAVAPWLPGHDGDPGWFTGDTFDDAVAAVARALVRLHSGRWHVAGYSLGGRVALGLLVRHPGLFVSAVVIGASAGLRSAAERQERRAADARWAEMLREEGMERFVAAWEGLPLFASQRALPPARTAAQRACRRRHHPLGLKRSLEVLGLGEMPDLWPALSEVRVPVRLVAGELDGKFTELAHAMAAELPEASVTIVPRVGHNVVLEAPEAIAGMLREQLVTGGVSEVT
jgi:2-succinyl-6-hydroxy-2,4-cyclohexadiene-1-carboxylate synthase